MHFRGFWLFQKVAYLVQHIQLDRHGDVVRVPEASERILIERVAGADLGELVRERGVLAQGQAHPIFRRQRRICQRYGPGRFPPPLVFGCANRLGRGDELNQQLVLGSIVLKLHDLSHQRLRPLQRQVGVELASKQKRTRNVMSPSPKSVVP